MRILLEAKTIQDEYEKDWSQIEKSIFDKIIELDPLTNIEANRIGPSAKQLLLPSYLEGEVDFLNDLENVKQALSKYTKERSSFPPMLRNITAFPSVKDFVDYVLNGEESDFAKRVDLTAGPVEKNKKESKIDQIYNKYYSDIDRETFDKIIALDPETTETSIGSTAKQLLLPKFKQGEDFLSKDLDVTEAIKIFNEDKQGYPEEKQLIQNFESVEDFVNYVKVGPVSTLWLGLMENNKVDRRTGNPVKDDVKLIASTRDYDVIQPLSHTANNAITCLNENRSRGNEYQTWCTGWTDDTSQWNGHSSREYIYCFMYKKDLKDRLKNYQLAIRKDDYTVYQFLDGNDNAYGHFNAGSDTSTKFFDAFLKANPDVLNAIHDKQYLKDCPTISKNYRLLKYVNKPFILNNESDLIVLETDSDLKGMIKEVVVNTETIPARSFLEASALNKLTLNPGLKRIGIEAFMKCTALESLELPEGLEEIGAEAFANCNNLKGSVKIPNSLTKIGLNAFRDTKCVLSIDKDRKTPLHIDNRDKDWFLHHHKGITVQKKKEESLMQNENINEEKILDENIPLDLVRAYQNSTMADRGIINNPSSQHWHIGSASIRKGSRYDYARSNYEEISKEEAKEIIKNNRNDIQNLRFIIDGQVVEYEIRSGNRLYQTYWMFIPQTLLDEKGLTILDKNGNPTNDSRYAIRYGDLNTIIELADKIYKTDEYEHLITPETKTGKKVKLLRKDANGNPVVEPVLKDDGTPELDSSGNPITRYVYDIIDDTFFKRRERTRRGSLVKRSLLPGEADYRPHKPFDNYVYGKSKEMIDNPDTGWHSATMISNVYPEEYRKALDKKKTAFKQYDYVRNALNKLEKEKDLYDDIEYNELHDKFTENKKKLYDEYLDSVNNFKKVKQDITLTYDGVVLELKERLKNNLKNLQELKGRLFQLENSISDNLLKPASSHDLDRLQLKVKSQLSDLGEMISKKEAMLAEIEQLKRAVETSDISIADISTKIQEVKEKIEAESENVIKQKFKKLSELEAERDQVKQELRNKFAKTAADKDAKAAKNKQKELDTSLSDIITFDDILASTPDDLDVDDSDNSSDMPF